MAETRIDLIRDDRDKLLAALRLCVDEIQGLFNSLDPQEISDSFRGFDKALKQARAAIARPRA